MTREEAIEAIKFGHCDDIYYRKVYEEAVNMAIKALEQEPFMNKPCVAHQVCHEDKVKILDKIRAEIMDFEEELFHRPNTDYSDYAAVRHCVEIIDKYKAESEG